MADDQFLSNDPNDVNPIEEMKDHQKLPQDHDPPFSPPDELGNRVQKDAPFTDTGMDPTGQYNGGTDDEASVDLPDQVEGEDLRPAT